MASNVELHLVRQADTAWAQVIRPWLEAGSGALRRSFVVVPTRGQAHALKRRCLVEGLPLLGVEFLTPALARKKWLALARAEPPRDAAGSAPSLFARPVPGREQLLLGCRVWIEKKLAALAADDPARGFWRSLQSDPGRALDDFDELLCAGFRAGDAPELLSEIFGGLEAWIETLGETLAQVQDQAAALQVPTPGAPPAAARLLVLGLTAESWGDFFSVAALARRCGEVVAVLPEPEFRGRRALDERWIEIWQAFLGVEPVPADAPDAPAPAARIIVGETRGDEMALVAEEVDRLLADGGENIAVVFPRSDAAHLQLVHLLRERGIAFADLLEVVAPPSLEMQVQRALLEFHRSGGRLEKLLALWPLLLALGHVKASLGEVRAACERLFDECHSHTLAACAERLLADRNEAFREIGRFASRLPPWPAELTLGDALARFASLCADFLLPLPPGLAAWEELADREKAPLPAQLVLETLELLVPQGGAAAGAAGRGLFARVTLTTRRRAEGVAWSHVIFVESNAGVWPMRREPSPWLTDELRTALNERGRFSLGLFTSEDRAALERQGLAGLMREARQEVIFSAACHDEADPDLPLGPNRFVERVLLGAAGADSLEAEWIRLARRVAGPVPAPVPENWRRIWLRRRDPAAPFDEFFFSGEAEKIRPASLAARLVESGARDPAELWFDAVLGVSAVSWRPLTRAREKSLGLLAHRVMAAALRAGGPADGAFGRLPSPGEARERLTLALAELRTRWPRDRYWDSFHAELTQKTSALLAQVFDLCRGEFAGIELPLPRGGVSIPAGIAARLTVRGRIDLVLLDRPEWRGARVDIFDFKTGADNRLSASRMAKHGDALQLGVYLAAAAALGAAAGRVWMLKPDGGPSSLAMDELPDGLEKLPQIARHLATGRYGALTPDRTEFAEGRPWPLACAPIAHEVLAAKFAATFPETEAARD